MPPPVSTSTPVPEPVAQAPTPPADPALAPEDSVAPEEAETDAVEATPPWPDNATMEERIQWAAEQLDPALKETLEDQLRARFTGVRKISRDEWI